MIGWLESGEEVVRVLRRVVVDEEGVLVCEADEVEKELVCDIGFVSAEDEL